MKTKMIGILFLLCTSILYAQKFKFPAYGIVNNYTNGSVMYAPSDLIISNLGNGKYSIIGYDPQDGSISMDANFNYKLYNTEREYYVYEGTLKFGEMPYNCVIRTKIKMSEFIQGNGNKDNFVFEKKYEIKIFYSRYGNTIDSMNDMVSIYPIKN